MTPPILHKLRTVVVIVFLAMVPATGNAGLKPADQLVLDLINQFRTAPFDTAVSLGYDPAALQAMGVMPDTFFPPYVPDEELCLVAAGANAQVLSPEPLPAPAVPERVRMADTGSVLTFANFISDENAAAIFVRNLFRSELNTGKFDFILSDTNSHAGTSVDPGTMDGSNAWLFTLVTASAARTRDMQVLNLINQVRADTALIVNYLPSGMLSLLQHNWQIFFLLKLNFQPLFFDEFLYWCAGQNNLADPGIHPPDQGSGSVPAGDTGNVPGSDAAVDAQEDPTYGYPGALFRLTGVTSAWDDMAPVDPVTDLFSGLLSSEFVTWPYGAAIFSNRFKSAGTAIALSAMDSGGTGTLSFAAGSDLPAEPYAGTFPPVRIYGLLFSDQDGDTIYSPGEEVSGHTVTVLDEAFVPWYQVVTDRAGHFSLSLEPGRYWYVVAQKDDQVIYRELFLQKNSFVKLGFNPPPASP
jgi:hypothetical protein